MDYSWQLRVESSYLFKRMTYLEDKLLQIYRLRGRNMEYLAREKELGEYYNLVMLAHGSGSVRREEAA